MFNKNYPQQNSIYNCLPKNTNQDEIKKMDMETYSERADEFDEAEMLKLSTEETDIIKPLTKLPQDAKILELAGGNGRFVFYLAKLGFNMIESDIAYGSVAKVKSVADKNNINNITYAIIDAENLPFQNDSLDAIFMVASLHHLPDVKKAIAEIARVLKPDGQLLILREPASWQYYFFYPITIILQKLLRYKNKNAFSLADDVTWGFSQRKLKKLLASDFKNIKIKPVHYLRKIYTNWLVLKSKLARPAVGMGGFTGKKYTPNKRIEKSLKNIDDNIISKIPIIKNLSWDWDIYGKGE